MSDLLLLMRFHRLRSHMPPHGLLLALHLNRRRPQMARHRPLSQVLPNAKQMGQERMPMACWSSSLLSFSAVAAAAVFSASTAGGGDAGKRLRLCERKEQKRRSLRWTSKAMFMLAVATKPLPLQGQHCPGSFLRPLAMALRRVARSAL